MLWLFTNCIDHFSHILLVLWYNLSSEVYNITRIVSIGHDGNTEICLHWESIIYSIICGGRVAACHGRVAIYHDRELECVY